MFLLKLSDMIPCGRSLFVGDVLAAIAFFCMSMFTVTYTCEFTTREADFVAAVESFAMIISFVGTQARFAILFYCRVIDCVISMVISHYCLILIANFKSFSHFHCFRRTIKEP